MESIDFEPDFITGLIFGALVIIGCILLAVNHGEKACEKKHNVFACKSIYVPVVQEKKDNL